MAEERQQTKASVRSDDTFNRHGPEPPENDSGPSPSVEERRREDARSHAARESATEKTSNEQRRRE
jgi:hypothetical protein